MSLDKFNFLVKFPDELKEWKFKIEEESAKLGFTHFPVIYEMVSQDMMCQLASRAGFPDRYPHWSFGQEYNELIRQHDYQAAKIYEMIINSCPIYAYLMTSNTLMDQKLVMCHCLVGETGIDTLNGIKKISDIKFNDLVYTHKGRFRPVIQTFKRKYSGDIYTIKTAFSDISLTATSEHPIMVAKFGFIQTQDLMIGNFVAYPKPKNADIAKAIKDRMPKYDEINMFEDANYVYAKITDITKKQFDGDVYNIHVAEDNSFVVESGFVTHNCEGHSFVFTHNIWFANSDRRMIDTMSGHARIVRQYIDQYGEKEVEDFIDICVSINTLVNKHASFVKKQKKKTSDKNLLVENETKFDDGANMFDAGSDRFYMDKFINKEEDIKYERDIHKSKQNLLESSDVDLPENDVLLFLIKRAPLKGWQRHILSIIYNEAHYFAPQMMTKIIHEGSAEILQSLLMMKHRICNDDELIDYADHAAGVLGGNYSTNPYKIGYEIMKDIEDRWNKGKFGAEYDECKNFDEKDKWDKQLGLGMSKVKEVMTFYNDVELIDEFFTHELCSKLKFFNYVTRDGYNTRDYVIEDREYKKIKNKLLFQLTNHGFPSPTIKDADYKNNGTLYMEHFTDSDYIFDVNETESVITNIQKLWKKPVMLQMENNNVKYTYVCDGGKVVKDVEKKHNHNQTNDPDDYDMN